MKVQHLILVPLTSQCRGSNWWKIVSSKFCDGLADDHSFLRLVLDSFFPLLLALTGAYIAVIELSKPLKPNNVAWTISCCLTFWLFQEVEPCWCKACFCFKVHLGRLAVSSSCYSHHCGEHAYKTLKLFRIIIILNNS